MKNTERKFGAPEWLIIIGGSFFILVLAVSAVWDVSIRWLHFFQAWMYVATIWLGLRRNRWGYFIGISAAGLWDYSTIFANTFLPSGLRESSRWIHTGHLTHPDQLIAVFAWTANLMVIIGCAWAYARRIPEKPASDILRFVIAFALTTGFFALDMWICQPRYLGIFPRLIHPHWPW